MTASGKLKGPAELSPLVHETLSSTFAATTHTNYTFELSQLWRKHAHGHGAWLSKSSRYLVIDPRLGPLAIYVQTSSSIPLVVKFRGAAMRPSVVVTAEGER